MQDVKLNQWLKLAQLTLHQLPFQVDEQATISVVNFYTHFERPYNLLSCGLLMADYISTVANEVGSGHSRDSEDSGLSEAGRRRLP